MNQEGLKHNTIAQIETNRNTLCSAEELLADKGIVLEKDKLDYIYQIQKRHLTRSHGRNSPCYLPQIAWCYLTESIIDERAC